jgi:predicted dienelactone hydrolase
MTLTKRRLSPWRRCHRWGLKLATGLAIALGTADGAFAADTIRITQGLLSISIPVAPLEEFAATGEVPPELQSTLGRFDADTLAGIRQRLTSPLAIDVVAMSQLAHSKLGQDYLTRMGKVVRTPSGQNGAVALRAAHVAAAQDPEGLTTIGLIRHFPTDIRISARDLLNLSRQGASFFDYKLAALEAIRQQAEVEITQGLATGEVDFTQQPDLRLPGPFSVSSETLTLVDADRPGVAGATERQFEVDLYLPQTQTAAPVVMISHGWGSAKESFTWLAAHLASHGFAVAVPQHIGSDRRFQHLFLSGIFDEDIPPREYIDRPLDISFTLDELEQRSAPGGPYQGRLDLSRVGMIGHSLGGYTTFAIAGAPINYPRLQQVCISERPFRFNLSIYLQCRAAPLPAVGLSLRDERVDAAIALNPITSVVQGPSQLEQIAIPTLVATASVDLLAPPVQEQIHPFTWLTTDEKYLVSMVPAGHGSSVQFDLADGEIYGGLAPNTTLGSDYTRALATAFMQVYAAQNPGYEPFLRAGYTSYLSQDPIQVDMVRSLTPAQLEAAYGKTPPLPLRPEDGSL